MSVKSIDTQIMIARTADVSRDASAMHKRTEAAQDILAFREKINDAQNQSRVAKTPETKLSELHNDKNGGGTYSGGSGSETGKSKKDEGPETNMLVPSGDSIIDITV